MVEMPSTKKTPAANARKKVTASARARINTGRTKRSSDNNGSYIQDIVKETDDLSLPEWAVGQLTNVHQIQDPTLLRQALLQVILDLRDATSLPWQAVRDAWSHAMHDIEEGRLTWADSTQWAINRLSAL